MMNQLTLTINLADVGEDIGLLEAQKLVKQFAIANPESTQGYYIGRNILEQILAQPGCVGINFRKCLTDINEEHLVYTGVDEGGKDIISFSIVTKDGNLISENGIVADKTWIPGDNSAFWDFYNL